MSPDDLIRLRHMAEAAEAAIAFLQGRSRAELDSNAILRFALALAVQIIGQAAARVPAAGRAQAAEIDSPVIVAMRHRLADAGFDVDTGIRLKTVTTSLPMLRRLRAVGSVGVGRTDPTPKPRGRLADYAGTTTAGASASFLARRANFRSSKVATVAQLL